MSETDGLPDFAYSYRPAVIGTERSFRLTPTGIAWDNGRRSGVVPYRDVTRVRLAYSPATMQQQRFVTQISASGQPLLTIVSTSWRGMFRQDAASGAYSRFIAELHRRLAQSGARAEFVAGSHPLIHGFGLLFGTLLAVAMVGLMVRSGTEGQWGVMAALIAMSAFFLWSGGMFFRRNWPSRYSADAPPQSMLPR